MVVWIYPLLLFATGLFLLMGIATGENPMCPDDYLYTQQPPADAVCSPYIRSLLQLDCEIVGEDVIEIRWYFSSSNSQTNATLLMNSTKYTLTPHRNNGNTGVQLTVRDLNVAEDIGSYWCQGVVPDSSLTSSDVFQLFDEDNYFPIACENILRRSTTTCASIIRISSGTTTQAPPLTTLPQTTPLETTPHPTLPETSPHPTPSQTLLFVTNQETTSTVVSTDFTAHTSPGPVGVSESQFILYVVLGLVGFLGIVCVALGVVIALLCRRRCQDVNANGLDNKDVVAFDHLSNQTDFGLVSIPKISSPRNTPYQPESTQSSLNGTQRRDLSGDYAEIGPALIMNNERLHHLHSSYPQPSNPPPLPHPHPRFMAFHSSIERAVDPYRISEYENPYDLPILLPEDTRPANFVATRSQNYDILERGLPPVRVREHSGVFSETSSFSTPPDSPPYHTLESPGIHLALTEISGTLDFPQEHRISRLETIPEHPYHVLEKESVQSASQLSASESTGDSPVVPFTTDSIDDLAYDRLIGPPHLYQILENSPSLNRPRIHRFQFSDHPIESRNEHATAHLTPSHSPDLYIRTESLSSDSSMSSASDVFDDPQYVLSPEPPGHSAVGDVVNSGCTHGKPPAFVQSLLLQKDSANHSKYCGDYERDPMYMQRLHANSTSPKLLLASPERVNCIDVISSQDDSGFYTYGIQQEIELKRQSSLPNIPHIYQSLQATTMDPHLPYQRVLKQGSQSSETST